MKRKILILTALLLVFTSCNKDNDIKVNEFVPQTINAKVENAAEYSNIVEVKLMVYDSSAGWEVELARGEWKDGGFSIELPKTLAPNCLYALINNSGQPSTIINPPSTVTISNKNVKLTNASFWGIDKNGNVVTHFYFFKIDEDANAKRAFYTYVDADVSISGHIKGEVAICEQDEDTNADIFYVWKKNTTYSIKWKKGWNVWCLSGSKSRTERIITEQWSTPPVSELKWYGGEDLWKLVFYH